MTTTIRAITAARSVLVDPETEEYDDRDALVEVEATGAEHDERPIMLHVDPRQPDIVTVSLSPDEAWRLCRDLARAAAESE